MGNWYTKTHYIASSDSEFTGSLSKTGSGYGKIVFKDNSVYIGNINNNLLNGYGTCQYANGSIYEGNWKDGVRDGKGKLYFCGGEVYFGNFEIDEINGKGMYTYNDGSYYEGDFKFGKRVGNGILYNCNKHILYSGEWRDDIQCFKKRIGLAAIATVVSPPILPLQVHTPAPITIPLMNKQDHLINSPTDCVRSRRGTKVSPFSSPDMNPANSDKFTVPILNLDKIKQPMIKQEFSQVIINSDVYLRPANLVHKADSTNPMFITNR